MFEDTGAKADMSPMIDLVFLLLIFFMIASTMITYQKDENVEIPIASAGKLPDQISGRVIINVYDDGTIKSEFGEVYTLADLENVMRKAKEEDDDVRLHVRADARADHRKVKDVIAASARGGVTKTYFSTYQY